MINYIFVSICILVGMFVGWLIRRQISQRMTESAESKAKDILTKAKVKQQEIFFKAREESLKIIDKAKKKN